MNKGRLLIAIAIAVLGLQVVGCGGGDTAPTISKADFISGGDQICAETVKEQAANYEQIVTNAEAEGTEVTPADGKKVEQELANVVASSVEDMVAEFEDLGTPAGKEEAVAKMLEQYEEGAEETRADPQAFLKVEAFVAADESAKKLGLEKCEGI